MILEFFNNPLGVRYSGQRFQNVTGNSLDVNYDPIESTNAWINSYSPGSLGSTNNQTGEYTEGKDGGNLWKRDEAWRKYQAEQNRFSFTRSFLVPGLQAAANLSLLKWQQDQYKSSGKEAQAIIEQTLSDYCDCIESQMDDILDAYPKIPKAARYIPPDACREQHDTICCNIDSILKNEEFIKLMDFFHIDQHVNRVKTLDREFVCKLESYNKGIKDLLLGRIDNDTLMETMTDSNELACATGRIGNNCRQSHIDLGITSLRMKELGRDRFERAASLWQQISPVEKLGDIRLMTFTPQQKMGWALTISQLVQNSLQNEYNMEAAGDPAKMAQIQIRLQKCLQTLLVAQGKANAISQFVPNYAAILQPQISSFTQGIGSFFNNWNSQPQKPPRAIIVEPQVNNSVIPYNQAREDYLLRQWGSYDGGKPTL